MSQYVYTPNNDDPDFYFNVEYQYKDPKEIGIGPELEIISILDPEGNTPNVSTYTRMQIEEDILEIEEDENEILLDDIDNSL